MVSPLLPQEKGELLPTLSVGMGEWSASFSQRGEREKVRERFLSFLVEGLGDGQTPFPKGEREGNLFIPESGLGDGQPLALLSL